jgi:F-actin capping protein alpha subunit
MTVKLPGGSQSVRTGLFLGRNDGPVLTLLCQVIVSTYNSLRDGRYYDVESSSSFDFDHITQVGPSVGQAERRLTIGAESEWSTELLTREWTF